MRSVLHPALFWGVLSAAVSCSIAPSLVSAQPNVVFVLIDDMSWSSTSVQMDPNVPDSKSDFHQTPRLEQLAAEGMVFSNGYAAGPICSPTRAAVMTGKSPAQLNVTDVRGASDTESDRFFDYYNGQPLVSPIPVGGFVGETTVANYVKSANSNYSAGFYGKFDWWPRPQDTGFDSSHTKYFRESYENDPAKIFAITNDSIDYMEQRVAENKPFFLTISHEAVKLGKARDETIVKYEALTPGVRHFDAEYAASHEDLDTSIGMVLDKIDDLGIADNTYVIFTADHGAPIGVAARERANEPLYGGKGTIWEGGLRVPFIVRGPGIDAGTRSDVPVSSIDLVPTIYDIVGGSGGLQAGVEGTTLLPLLQNAGQIPGGGQTLNRSTGENGELYFHYPHYIGNLPIGPTRPASAIRDGDYKLVKVFGENGAADQHLLFDLSNNIMEDSDPASALNLADQNPALVNQLVEKLERWFESVDATLPYDVRENISMRWALQPGQILGDKFRSETNVDSRDRETFTWLNADAPTTVASAAHQPGLPKSSLAFDGNQAGYRRYFHVSDARKPQEIDDDHSATFELWVKFDSLTNEQLFFEAGSTDQGLSLSLGDADSDGSANDLRFRLLSKTGEALTTTVPIDDFAAPTNEFVQVTGVVDDTPGSRAIELYINGVLRGRTEAADNASLDWDSFERGGLGGPSSNNFPNAIGSDSGAGDLPFTGGRLVGNLAEFEFHNTAKSQMEVGSSYRNALTPASLGVSTTAGAAEAPLLRPLNVAANAHEQDATLRIIHERRDQLSSNLVVDVLATGGTSISVDGSAFPGGMLSAGTEFSSYLLHYDAETESGGLQNLVGSVTFAAPILGLLLDEATLDASELLLNVAGEFELGDRSLDLAGMGTLMLSSDSRTLDFDLNLDPTALTQFRVLTVPLLSGDYDGDGDVDTDDYAVWHTEFGTVGPSLADGNLDGRVDSADYTLWRDNLGASYAATGLPGDYDADGDVDTDDYAVWKAEFGTVGPSLADGNFDGRVDAADYTLWRDNLGVSAATASVPEPSTAFLAYLGLVGLWSRRRLG